MTRKERLEAEKAQLITKRNNLVRNGELIKSMRIDQQIRDIEKGIKECEYYEFKPLGEILSRDDLARNKVYARLLEISLAADYLTDCAIDCRQILNKLGISDLRLLDDIEEIRKHANKLSAMPCRQEYAELYDLMMDNDELVDDMHDMTRKYINQKLKAKEYQT